jgi:hypothetical protein
MLPYSASYLGLMMLYTATIIWLTLLFSATQAAAEGSAVRTFFIDN